MSSDPHSSDRADDHTFRRVLACFALILLVLAGVVVVSLHNLNRSIATADWVNHTHALITELDALQPTLAAAEGDLSRYLLTSDPRDQESYRDKFAELGESVSVIDALIAGAPDEKTQFTPIAAILTRRAESASRISQLKKAGDAAALQKQLTEDAESGDRRELARALEKFRNRQTDLLSERDRVSFRQTQTTRWTVLGGLLLDFLLLCGAAWLIRDDLTVRRRAARLLEASNEQLEEKVRQRTAELTATNAQLVLQKHRGSLGPAGAGTPEPLQSPHHRFHHRRGARGYQTHEHLADESRRGSPRRVRTRRPRRPAAVPHPSPRRP